MLYSDITTSTMLSNFIRPSVGHEKRDERFQEHKSHIESCQSFEEDSLLFSNVIYEYLGSKRADRRRFCESHISLLRRLGLGQPLIVEVTSNI
jgi:hypothetical protein